MHEVVYDAILKRFFSTVKTKIDLSQAVLVYKAYEAHSQQQIQAHSSSTDNCKTIFMSNMSTHMRACREQIYPGRQNNINLAATGVEMENFTNKRYLCTYSIVSPGESYCIMHLTFGKSKPLAATSVDKRRADFSVLKDWNVVLRSSCFMFPCNLHNLHFRNSCRASASNSILESDGNSLSSE